MKKYSLILALLMALVLGFVGCGGGGGGGPEGETDMTIVLGHNFQYGHGYQTGVVGGTAHIDLLNYFEGKVSEGDEFVISFKVKADRDLEDQLAFGFVDPTEAADYWTKLTDSIAIGPKGAEPGAPSTPGAPTPPEGGWLKAGVEITVNFDGDDLLVAIASSKGGGKANNKLYFQTSGQCTAAGCATTCDWSKEATTAFGDEEGGLKGPVTLTITDFVLERKGEAVVCCTDDDCEADCKDCDDGTCTPDTECGEDCCLPPPPPLSGPLSLTDFTEAKKVSGYGAAYSDTEANTWIINGGYQAVRFSLGGVVTGENYKSVTITYVTDAVGTVSFRDDKGTVETIPGGYQGKIDLPVDETTVTVNIPAAAIFDVIAFESKAAVDDEDPATAAGGQITITITSVVFEEND